MAVGSTRQVQPKTIDQETNATRRCWAAKTQEGGLLCWRDADKRQCPGVGTICSRMRPDQRSSRQIGRDRAIHPRWDNGAS